MSNAWPRDDGIATVIILETARRFQGMTGAAQSVNLFLRGLSHAPKVVAVSNDRTNKKSSAVSGATRFLSDRSNAARSLAANSLPAAGGHWSVESADHDRRDDTSREDEEIGPCPDGRP